MVSVMFGWGEFRKQANLIVSLIARVHEEWSSV